MILNDAGWFAKMKPFEIFRPGSFTAMDGQPVNFSAEMLAEIASSYNPALHEAPLVIGHPQSDAPAYGWVRGLTYEEDRLVAEPGADDLEPAFAEMVQSGRFKKRSASFYPPQHPSNPTPGKWHLKHVGFLGAMPPAVRGLKEVAFSEDDEPVLTVEFSETERTMGWALRSMASMARSMRDYILSRDGEEVADKIIPNYTIDSMISDSARIEALNTASSYADPNPTLEIDVPKTQQELDARATELEAREADIKKREAEIAAQAKSFSEAEKKARRDRHEAALDGLIKEGRLVPGLKVETLNFLDGLDAVTTVEFGQGDGSVKTTSADWFLGLLAKSGTVVNFGEAAPGDGTRTEVVSFAAPEGATVDAAGLELHKKALAYQADHPNVEYMDAVHAVNGR